MSDPAQSPSKSGERLRRGDSRSLDMVHGRLGFTAEFANRPVSESHEVKRALKWLQEERPAGQNFWPALVLALTAQVETLLAADGVASVSDIFASYPPVTVGRGGAAVNTLNFESKSGDVVRLRSLYNKALDVIRNTMLRDHPNNPGHATQAWTAYRPLIEIIASMEPAERRAFADGIWRHVLSQPARQIAGVKERAVRPFEHVLRHMPTAVPRVRGGAVLQGLAYGYLRADSPNLILESHSVNTGSSRAGMLGDVDGFRGTEPELAAEVKDLVLDASNVETQISDFLEDIVDAPNVTAVVIAVDFVDGARGYIEDRGVTALSKADLIDRVGVWDLPKQEEALRGLEYYLGRVQKDQRAVDHVRGWLQAENVDAGLGAPLLEVAFAEPCPSSVRERPDDSRE